MRFFGGTSATASRSVGGNQDSDQGRELPDSLRGHVPARFEALGEALVAGHDVEAACSVTGRELARDGVDMAAALDGLQTTYAVVCSRQPDFDATHALCLAWSEETLAYLHQLSCEDPLTGMATLAHLRARLTEIYRGVEQRDASITTSTPIGEVGWALVVIDLPRVSVEDRFEHALHLVRASETVRLVFPGSEAIAQIAPSRLGVLARRTDRLGRRAAALRTLLADVGLADRDTDVDREGSTVRVWIEGLPSTDASAGALLDELART
ncbi:MAG TPA: hypothetical protein VFK34_06355 [Marmoricola sp.]|jgi:hypothetical protein|nr:hypothetical protein [Marmoricola sp.]